MPRVFLISQDYLRDGLGDFGLGLKWTEQIRRQYVQHGLEEPMVYIVTDEQGQKIIRQTLDGEREFATKAITVAELKAMIQEGGMDIEGVIQASVLYDSKVILGIEAALTDAVIKPVPLIFVSEAGVQEDTWESQINFLNNPDIFKNLKFQKMVYSGFASSEQGILLSNDLMNPLPMSTAIRNISSKILNQLLSPENTVDAVLDEQFQIYKDKTVLSLQYSNMNGIPSQGIPSTASRFLQIHRELYKGEPKNQDVIMVGGLAANKRTDLLGVVKKLKLDGFTSITFINADTGQNEVIYESSTEESPPKEYRAIYTSGMPHPSMIALYGLSGVLAGARGDCSFAEAISADKIVVYEDVVYKPGRMLEPYHQALMNESKRDQMVVDTLNLIRSAADNGTYEQLGQLLRTPGTKEKLVALNAQVKVRHDLSLAVFEKGFGWDNGRQSASSSASSSTSSSASSSTSASTPVSPIPESVSASAAVLLPVSHPRDEEYLKRTIEFQTAQLKLLNIKRGWITLAPQHQLEMGFARDMRLREGAFNESTLLPALALPNYQINYLDGTLIVKDKLNPARVIAEEERSAIFASFMAALPEEMRHQSEIETSISSSASNTAVSASAFSSVPSAAAVQPLHLSDEENLKKIIEFQVTALRQCGITSGWSYLNDQHKLEIGFSRDSNLRHGLFHAQTALIPALALPTYQINYVAGNLVIKDKTNSARVITDEERPAIFASFMAAVPEELKQQIQANSHHSAVSIPLKHS